MPILGALDRAMGIGKRKVESGTASITGTGSITTGLSVIEAAVVCVRNSGTTLPTRTASITSISGGTINVVVTEHGESSNAVATTEATVGYVVIGY
jgi:hypothetical protein